MRQSSYVEFVCLDIRSSIDLQVKLWNYKSPQASSFNRFFIVCMQSCFSVILLRDLSCFANRVSMLLYKPDGWRDGPSVTNITIYLHNISQYFIFRSNSILCSLIYQIGHTIMDIYHRLHIYKINVANTMILHLRI